MPVALTYLINTVTFWMTIDLKTWVGGHVGSKVGGWVPRYSKWVVQGVARWESRRCRLLGGYLGTISG